MKKLFLTIMATAIYSTVFAGGFFTNTNQNAYFLRNPGRGASSVEIDAVYSNPAGLSFMQHEGLTLSLNNQSAFQTRTATGTFAPFAMNGGNVTKEFEGKAQALFIPSMIAAYKWNRLVFSGSFAIIGGGGTLKFDDGLPMFESQVALLPVMLSEQGMPTNQYSLESKLKGNSITYGAQLGITYRINRMFSGFIGARTSFVNNGYEGYIRNIQANIGGGPTQNANWYFTNMAAQLTGLAGGLQDVNADYPLNVLPAETFAIYQSVLGDAANALTVGEAQAVLTEKAATATGVATQTADRNIDLTQSGWGIAPILGLNFNYEKLNIGIKYDFNTNIKLENKTKANTSGMPAFDDKVKSDYDIPALLSVGASYKFLDNKLSTSLGYHIFFDKQADYTSAAQNNLDGNLQEFLAGVEYRICDRVLVSAGGQITRQGITDDYLTDLNFTSNSFSVGFGTQIKITEKLAANLAYFFTRYEDYTKNNSIENPANLPSKTIYSRTNNVFGIGLDYKF